MQKNAQENKKRLAKQEANQVLSLLPQRNANF
jgi:hypothetical protein